MNDGPYRTPPPEKPKTLAQEMLRVTAAAKATLRNCSYEHYLRTMRANAKYGLTSCFLFDVPEESTVALMRRFEVDGFDVQRRDPGVLEISWAKKDSF